MRVVHRGKRVQDNNFRRNVISSVIENNSAHVSAITRLLTAPVIIRKFKNQSTLIFVLITFLETTNSFHYRFFSQSSHTKIDMWHQTFSIYRLECRPPQKSYRISTRIRNIMLFVYLVFDYCCEKTIIDKGFGDGEKNNFKTVVDRVFLPNRSMRKPKIPSFSETPCRAMRLYMVCNKNNFFCLLLKFTIHTKCVRWVKVVKKERINYIYAVAWGGSKSGSSCVRPGAVT